MKERIDSLTNVLAQCIQACNRCFDACLGEDDVKMMADCIRLDRQCAEICSAALLLLGEGSFQKEILELCAKACRDCGQECGKHHYDHCRECAEVCLRCERACEEYSRSGTGM